MTTSKSEKLSSTGEVKLWKLPEVLDEKKAHQHALATATELENIQKQAYAEAHEKGYQDGLKRSEKELKIIQQKARQFETLMAALSEPFTDMDDMVIEQVTDLSIAIARQLIRRELRADPGQVIAIVRQAMAELPIGSRNIQIHLHHEDASLVRDAFSTSDNEQAIERLWHIVEDPAQERGGCHISSENSAIDATIDARLNRIAAQLLDGERKNDSSDT